MFVLKKKFDELQKQFNELVLKREMQSLVDEIKKVDEHSDVHLFVTSDGVPYVKDTFLGQRYWVLSDIQKLLIQAQAKAYTKCQERGKCKP